MDPGFHHAKFARETIAETFAGNQGIGSADRGSDRIIFKISNNIPVFIKKDRFFAAHKSVNSNLGENKISCFFKRPVAHPASRNGMSDGYGRVSAFVSSPLIDRVNNTFGPVSRDAVNDNLVTVKAGKIGFGDRYGNNLGGGMIEDLTRILQNFKRLELLGEIRLDQIKIGLIVKEGRATGGSSPANHRITI